MKTKNLLTRLIREKEDIDRDIQMVTEQYCKDNHIPNTGYKKVIREEFGLVI